MLRLQDKDTKSISIVNLSDKICHDINIVVIAILDHNIFNVTLEGAKSGIISTNVLIAPFACNRVGREYIAYNYTPLDAYALREILLKLRKRGYMIYCFDNIEDFVKNYPMLASIHSL